MTPWNRKGPRSVAFAILASPGTYPRPVEAQRSRCEPGAVPQLRCPCAPRPGTSQVACSPPTNSALGGRAVRAAPPPSHLPSLHAEVFMFRFRYAAALALAALALAAPGRRPPLGDPDADRLPLPDRDRGSVRDRRRQASGGGRQPVELPGRRTDDEAVGLHAERRGDRRLQAGPRRDLGGLERARRRPREAVDSGAPRSPGDGTGRGLRPDQAAREGDRPRSPAPPPSSRG